MKLSFTVIGKCEPQGSMKAFIPKGWSRPVLTSDNKNLKSWRQEIARTAAAAIPEQNDGICEPVDSETPVFIRMDFYVLRPRSKPKKVTEPVTRPDLDKYCRGAFDALKGIAFKDDSQIVQAVMAKHYGEPERVEIFLSTEDHEFRNDSRVKETMELFA